MLLALAAGVLSVLGGAFMPPLLIPAAAVIGFIGNAYGTLYCGIALAVSLGGIAALLSSNVLTMLCIAGFVLLSSVTLGIGLRKRLPYRLLAVLVAFLRLPRSISTPLCLHCLQARNPLPAWSSFFISLKTHTNKPVSIFHRFSFQQKFCRKFSTVSSLLLPKV